MMYSIAICDDDNLIIEQIADCLHKAFSQHNAEVIIDYYNSGDKLLLSIDNTKYDIILLDINMEPMDEFGVAGLIAVKDKNAKIVFVTSHEEVVYDSFDYRPFYFIRKSLYSSYVERMVNKFFKIISHETDVLVENHNSIIKVNSSDIEYAESEDHYITIYTHDGDYVLRKKLSDFEQEMSGFNMARAHKKYVINYQYVRKVDYVAGEVIMKDGKKLKLGRSYKDTFKKGLVQYHRTL